MEKACFRLSPAILVGGILIIITPSAEGEGNTLSVTVISAAAGRQIVRLSLPFPTGMLRDEYGVVAHDGHRDCAAAVRILTYHPTTGHEPRSGRRAMVTFPYDFAGRQPTGFVLRAVPLQQDTPSMLPVQVHMQGDTVRITYRDGRVMEAKLLAPALTPPIEARTETVESNACFLWQRTHLPDTQWPRVIEVRADALGTVAVVAHLQRKLTGDGRAPDFGWEITTRASFGRLLRGSEDVSIGQEVVSRPLTDGKPCTFVFGDGGYRIYQPTVPLKRRGRVEVRRGDGDRLTYRYWRCGAAEKVPMQQAAWHRAEFVVAPANQTPLTATLECPHEVRSNWKEWDGLYAIGQPLDLTGQPDLSALTRYHHDAIIRSMAVGDDWGNVTACSDGAATGGAFGMNRLNHCPAIFEEGLRSGGDRRLLEVAVLWCDNFYDQSIWWGPGQTGGTRYNNLIAMGQTPPDNDQSYMWRSNSSVNFCTKGYDSFFLAYEQTGDPRMLEALDAQVRYAAEHVHTDRGECRNIGDVRDFVRLYEFTGQRRYLDEALRLFRELRTKLSAGDLFSQGGQPTEPDPPFINDDQVGYKHPFAKPYIIGYALAGLPILARHAPNEPKLRDVVRAVADFLADSQDPIGGWRYPHPRSSYLIMSQALEHAWQLAQADRLLGPQPKHLDAIERVLRQRIHGWRKTGKVFAGITGWELATGKVKDANDLYKLYRFPGDRDFTRDYVEGQPDFGSAPPEGLVYFPEVLAFYLNHRPASRLLAPPKDDEPLGKVLARVR
jgi:hypothetical protein